MKNKFEKLELEIIDLEVKDILTTSQPFDGEEDDLTKH